MDWNDLKNYIGVESANENDLIEACYNDAVDLLTDATSVAFRPIPEGVFTRMVLEVGNELYNRKNTPSGSSMFTGYDGGSIPVRGPRDPLTQVRPILAMYVVPF